MPIAFDVIAAPNEASFKKIADQAEKRLGVAGKNAGRAFGKSLEDTVSKADVKIVEKWEKAYDRVADAAGNARTQEAKLDELRTKGASNTRIIAQAEALEKARRAETRATKEAANAYSELGHKGNGLLSTLTDLSSGTRFGGLISSTEQLAGKFGNVGMSVGAATTGIAAVGVAAIATAKQLYDLGAMWDDIADSITVRTGKVGDDLEAMMNVVGDVGASTAASLGSIGDIVGQLSQNMPGLEPNGEAIRLMASNLAYLDANGQAVNIRALGQAFTAFGVPAVAQVKTLDDLNHVAQSTGIPINDLIQSVQSGAPQFKQFGLSISQATGLMAQFEQAGLDPNTVVTGLKVGLKNVGDDARGAAPALADVVTQIKALHDAGNEGGARTAAQDFFGAKNFAPFLDAIESGRVSVDSLKASIEGAGQSIASQQALTDDWSQSFEKIKNKLSTGLKPTADFVFGGLNSTLDKLAGNLGLTSDKLDEMQESLQKVAAVPITPDSALGKMLTPAGLADASTPGVGLPHGIGGGLGSSSGMTTPGGLLAPHWGDNPFSVSRGGGGGGSGPGAAEVPYGQLPGLMPGVPMTSEVYGAQSSLWEANHDVEEKRSRLNQVSADNTAKESDVVAARNDVAKAERAQSEAQMRFQTVQQTAYESQFKKLEKLSDGLGQIGAALDDDLGISDGLPGIAENLTKFLANLAMAPVVGALTGVQTGLGFKPGDAGSGLAGMLAGPLGLGSSTGSTGSGQTISSGQTGGGGSPNLSAMYDLAQWASGRTKYAGASDLIGGLADCSGSISDLYEVLTTGQSNSGRQFTTTNFATDAEAAKLGFLPGYMPGALNVGVNPYPGNSGHMAATLPNGVNFEGGGGTGGGAQYGGSAAGAMDPQFEKHYYLPVGPSAGVGMSPSAGGSVAPTGGGPTPVWVVNMPGGGMALPGVSLPTGVPADTTNGGGSVSSAPSPSTGGGGGMGPVGSPVSPGAPAVVAPPLSGPVLTNPGLTPPIPGAAIAPSGGGMGTGAVGPGMAPLPGAFGANPAASPVGGQQMAAGQGGGFAGLGGLPMAAIQGAIGAAGMGGAGFGGQAAAAAAQMGIQLANRAAGYAGQVGGIAASGLMETFLPSGDNPLSNIGNSWLGKLAGGLVGARPAMPNMSEQKAPPNPNDPNSQNGQPGDKGGNTQNNVTVTNTRVTKDLDESGIRRELAAMHAPPGQSGS